MKVIIMAGGKGTRISEVHSDIPKPMIPVIDKPILQYQIECLSKQGYNDIYLVIGYLGTKIKDYFQDGKAFGVTIKYIEETTPLGTAGALYYLKKELVDDFLLINGDIIFDVDLDKFVNYHKGISSLATILTHPNDHPYDSGIIIADETKKVTEWLHKEDKRGWFQNRVNAGIHILSSDVLSRFNSVKKMDLDRDILKPLIQQNGLFVYDSPEYVKDMGTPERLERVIKDIEIGRVSERNLKYKQKCIFLDRDGTINNYKGFLSDIHDFELNKDIAKTIKMINNSSYLCIVITNQPVVARGEISLDGLKEIHNKMETLLGEYGAYIDALYFCPHHPDRGFDGENSNYKIDCECRKPKPGMLIKAAKRFNIDLSQSYMIGDSDRDVKAGIAAGCKTIKINRNESLFTYISSIIGK